MVGLTRPDAGAKQGKSQAVGLKLTTREAVVFEGKGKSRA